MRGIAIADHDNIDAYKELESAHSEASTDRLRIIPAVEVSASRGDTTIHVLGYYPQGFSSSARAWIEELVAARRARLERGLKALAARGVHLRAAECAAAAAGRVVCRSHLAAILCQRGFAPSPRAAYRHLLSPAVFPSTGIAATTAIRRVGETGGIAVWAHPRRDELPEHLSAFVDAGLTGLEVLVPWRRRAESRALRAFAEENGLCVTAGSDWHGIPGGPELGRFSAPAEEIAPFLELLSATGARPT